MAFGEDSRSMKFQNAGLERAGRQWSMSLGVFLGILAILAVAGWQGFSAIGEFLKISQKPKPAPKTVPITVLDKEK